MCICASIRISCIARCTSQLAIYFTGFIVDLGEIESVKSEDSHMSAVYTNEDTGSFHYYKIIGKGPVFVVFIQGLLCDSSYWDEQYEHFRNSSEFQILMLDNRGIGKSSSHIGRYTTKEMAKDVKSLMDYLGWQKVHIVGVSMGGMISQELVLLLGEERVLSLVLVSTHAGGWANLLPPAHGLSTLVSYGSFRLGSTLKTFTNSFQAIQSWIGNIFESAMLQRTGISSYTAAMWSMIRMLAVDDVEHNTDVYIRLLHGSAMMKPENEALREKVRVNLKEKVARDIEYPTPLSTIAGQMGAIATHYMCEKRLGQIREMKFMKLVATGDEDKLIRATNSAYLAKMLNATYVLFEGHGHFVQSSSSEIINPMLEELWMARGNFCEPLRVPRTRIF
eukprot:CFRG1394T1